MSKEHRRAARDAWLQASGDKAQAIQLMQQDPRASGCKRMDRMLIRWGRDFEKRGTLSDQARSGRPKQLPDAAALRAAAILKTGYKASGVHKCYSSFSHALSLNQELQSILQTAGVGKKHLLQGIKNVDSSPAFRMLHIKNALTHEERSERMRISRHMIREFSRADCFSKRIFWIDAKKMHVSLKSQKVWLDSENPPETVEDARAQGARGGWKTLHFYAAVNACQGPVAFVFITGTTGLQRNPPYRVRCSCQ